MLNTVYARYTRLVIAQLLLFHEDMKLLDARINRALRSTHKPAKLLSRGTSLKNLGKLLKRQCLLKSFDVSQFFRRQ